MVNFKYLKNLKKQIKSIFKNKNEKLINIIELLINVACYGFVLNLIAISFFNYSLSFLNAISFGFVWYFISAEIPLVVDKYRGRKE